MVAVELRDSTSLFEMSIRTAKLVMWLHWQLMWLLFLLSTSQPLEDQPPLFPFLRVLMNRFYVKTLRNISVTQQ